MLRLHSTHRATVVGRVLSNIIYVLGADIELDFSEMTKSVIVSDRKRKERDRWVSSPIPGRIDSNPVWKSESDRFGISSAARERGSLWFLK